MDDHVRDEHGADRSASTWHHSEVLTHLSREELNRKDKSDVTQRHAMLSAGYLVLDIVKTPTSLRHTAGGTAGNVAANYAWLGLNSSILARVGADAPGEAIARDLLANGVSLSYLQHDTDIQTPCLVHQVSQSGHSYSYSCPTCSRRFQSYRPPSRSHEPDVPSVYFFDRAGSVTLATAEIVRASGGLVVFEPNGLGRANLTRRAIAISHVVKVSGDKQADLEPAIRSAPSPELQILTQGASGLKYRIRGERWRFIPPYPIANVIDAGGAGDWVSAALLSRINTESCTDAETVAAALRIGAALAAISCEYIGARGMAIDGNPDTIAKRVEGLAGLKLDTPRGYTPQTAPTEEDFSCATCLISQNATRGESKVRTPALSGIG